MIDDLVAIGVSQRGLHINGVELLRMKLNLDMICTRLGELSGGIRLQAFGAMVPGFTKRTHEKKFWDRVFPWTSTSSVTRASFRPAASTESGNEYRHDR